MGKGVGKGRTGKKNEETKNGSFKVPKKLGSRAKVIEENEAAFANIRVFDMGDAERDRPSSPERSQNVTEHHARNSPRQVQIQVKCM